jgi:hypothetical protein
MSGEERDAYIEKLIDETPGAGEGQSKRGGLPDIGRPC